AGTAARKSACPPDLAEAVVIDRAVRIDDQVSDGERLRPRHDDLGAVSHPHFVSASREAQIEKRSGAGASVGDVTVENKRARAGDASRVDPDGAARAASAGPTVDARAGKTVGKYRAVDLKALRNREPDDAAAASAVTAGLAGSSAARAARALLRRPQRIVISD